jgi:plastocyanin
VKNQRRNLQRQYSLVSTFSMMNSLMKPFYFSLFFAILLCAGCKSEKAEPENKAAEPAQAVPPSPPVDKSTAGLITGTVAFKGSVGKLKTIDMSQDPSCPTDPQIPDVMMVSSGKLANVFVYVKEGLGPAAFPASSQSAVLDQKGCRYAPHVLGLMVGQTLKILNSDLTEHNVHPMPKNNADWNESQMPRGAPITKTFQHPEIMMPVQCNQHPWMKAYVSVLPHPYFTVTGQDGSFQINDRPPGEYTLAAIHEKLGEQNVKIKIGPKETAKANFSFAAQ